MIENLKLSNLFCEISDNVTSFKHISEIQYLYHSNVRSLNYWYNKQVRKAYFLMREVLLRGERQLFLWRAGGWTIPNFTEYSPQENFPPSHLPPFPLPPFPPMPLPPILPLEWGWDYTGKKIPDYMTDFSGCSYLKFWVSGIF